METILAIVTWLALAAFVCDPLAIGITVPEIYYLICLAVLAACGIGWHWYLKRTPEEDEDKI